MDNKYLSLLETYETIFKILSLDIVHFEDLYINIKKLPDFESFLLMYEGLGFFEPLVGSTNSNQVMRRLPPKIINELAIASLLNSAHTITTLAANSSQTIEQTQDMLTRRQVFIEKHKVDTMATGAVTSNFILGLLFVFNRLKLESEFYTKALQIIAKYRLQVHQGLENHLYNSSKKSRKLLDEEFDIFAIGLSDFSDVKLGDPESAYSYGIKGYGNFITYKMMLQPDYIKRSAKYMSFYSIKNILAFID